MRRGGKMLGVLVMAWACVPGAAAQTIALTGPGVNPADFRVTTFASSLSYPIGMAEMEDGSLLVAVNVGVDFFASTGQILRLVDTDEDGVADGPGTLVADGLPGSQVGLAAVGDLVVVSGRENVIVVLRRGASPSSPLVEQGRLHLLYPSGWLHRMSTVTMRKTPGEANRYDVVFQVGSKTNLTVTTETATLSNTNISGASGTLAGDALHMITLADHGTHVTASNLQQIAGGLRNPAGHAFHPVTGDLYFQDNGNDAPNHEAGTADELNILPRADIGGAIENFGWPGTTIEYRTGNQLGSGGIAPLVNFLPLPDPATGAESEGPNHIAIAPPGFPEGLNTGVFLGFHGRYHDAGLANEENPVVYADAVTGDYFHFIEGHKAGIGHPDGILSTRDSLFVADVTTTGHLRTSGAEGKIYQIKAVTPPVPPAVEIVPVGNELEITWDRGQLLTSDLLGGTWSAVEDAVSPYRITPAEQWRFYRASF